jgi:esterase/lipase superfamily enzyme
MGHYARLSTVPLLLGLFSFFALPVTSLHAQAQRREALVFGNAAYRHAPRLVNPLNDARATGEAFTRLGFTVRTILDSDLRSMRNALLEFRNRLADADVGVFYFAGHSQQINEQNYLLPVDAELKTDADAPLEAIDLAVVMQALSTPRGLGLILIDASRDSPFARSGLRSVRRGLAPVDPLPNVVVSYSAREGTTAADGMGQHSPYTNALLRNLEIPGLDVNLLLRRVRDDVLTETGRRQEPFVYGGSLGSEPIQLHPRSAPSASAPSTDPCHRQNACTTVPVLFGTDRKREDSAARVGYGPDRANTLELGHAIVTVPQNTNRQRGTISRPAWWERALLGISAAGDPARHFTIPPNGIVVYASVEEFVGAVRQQISSAGPFKDHAFVFVHGYRVTFEEALYRTAQIAYDLGSDNVPFGTAFLYSWPASGGAKDYEYDVESARLASDHLKTFLDIVLSKTEARHVHLIAHSMGNWPLLNALAQVAASSKGLPIINQLILAAPDIDAGEFLKIARNVTAVAHGVTLYASSNDVALIASRQLRRGRPRAGDVSEDEGPVIVPGIDTIDVSAISTDILSWRHTLYAEHKELLNDIALLLRKGERPPSSRMPILETKRFKGQVYWRYPN